MWDCGGSQPTRVLPHRARSPRNDRVSQILRTVKGLDERHLNDMHHHRSETCMEDDYGHGAEACLRHQYDRAGREHFDHGGASMVAMIAPRRRFGLPPALDINSLDAESLIGLSINAVPEPQKMLDIDRVADHETCRRVGWIMARSEPARNSASAAGCWRSLRETDVSCRHQNTGCAPKPNRRLSKCIAHPSYTPGRSSFGKPVTRRQSGASTGRWIAWVGDRGYGAGCSISTGISRWH